MTTRRRLLVLAVLVSPTVAACTSTGPKEPSVSDFAGGTCRQAASATLSVGKLVRKVRDDHEKPAAVQAAMTRDQTALRALPPAQDAKLALRVQDLVAAIGGFRIGLDSHTYQPARLDEVAAAQRQLVGYCTSASARPGGG